MWESRGDAFNDMDEDRLMESRSDVLQLGTASNDGHFRELDGSLLIPIGVEYDP